MGAFQKTVLPNGIRIVSEHHPYARAVSLGVWVTTGTRDEREGEEGISHLLEHMVFKGTKTRNAYQIARSLESLGGDLNAYTTKEYTCYHATVLKDHWPVAVDVLSDLVSNMRISAKDFRLEKGVILQEIGMTDDNHEELIYDILFDKVYGANPLARPILGTIKSVAQMKLSQVGRLYRELYGANAIIVSASGPIDHFALVEAVKTHLKTKKKAGVPPPRRAPRWRIVREVIEKEAEIVNCLWAMPTSSFTDRNRFEAYIVNTALGGGMTSRLYQAVRERKGLVYSISSSLNTFVDCGMINIHAAADLDNVKEVSQIVAAEVSKLKRNGLSKSEIDLFKTQLTGGLLLGADDLESRMTSIGINEMIFEKYRPIEEIVEEIEAIDEKRIRKFLREEFDVKTMSGIVMGPGVKKIEKFWKELKFGGRR